MKLQGLSATWLKDNKPIGEELAARVKIVAKENVFTLSFDKAQAGDKGTYACRVTNANGEATTCSAQLEVHTRKWSIVFFKFQLDLIYLMKIVISFQNASFQSFWEIKILSESLIFLSK